MKNQARIPDSSQYGLTLPAFLAMITKSNSAGRSKSAKRFKQKSYASNQNMMFILNGETHNGKTYKHGLYRLISVPMFLNWQDKLKGSKIQQLQRFEDKPVETKGTGYDWRGEAEKPL